MHQVLLVEDEESFLNNLQFMVEWEKMGFVVIAAVRNGREGMEWICRHHPDLVITDIGMPEMDGLQMLQETRKEAEYESIILSGCKEFSCAQKAIELGVMRYLLKPVNPEELRRALEDAGQRIAKRKKQRQQEEEKRSPVSSVLLFPLEEGNRPTRTEQMIHYIQQNFNTKITIQDLSREMNLSISYLHSLFKENTGYTFNNFLNRYRVQQAVRYMQEGEMKIYEIAEAVGIPDYKYFNRVFKKYIGVASSCFLRKKE